MQISTSLLVFASAIALGVNWRNLSAGQQHRVDGLGKTMQDAVPSQNCSFLVAPTAS